MEKFSSDFREKYPHSDHLDGAEEAYQKLLELRRGQIYIPKLLPEYEKKGYFPQVALKVLVLCQCAIRRSIELADSMIRDANAFSYTPVWTSSRSLFELGSLIFDAKERVRALLNKCDKKALEEFSEHMDNVLLGFKSMDWHPKSEEHPDLIIQAKNVLTIIDRIDAKVIPGYRKLYDLLSEVAHPNYMGMLEQYQRLSDDRMTIDFFDAPAARDVSAITIPLDNAHGSLDILATSIAAYEEWFPAFAKACEDHGEPPPGFKKGN